MTAYLYPDSSMRLENKFFALGDGQTTIGRNPANTIVILLASISRFHATIECKNNNYFVKDNNSSNGTFINSIKVRTLQLIKEGDELTCGHAQFIFSFLPPEDYFSKGSSSFPSIGITLINDESDDNNSHGMVIATQATVPSIQQTSTPDMLDAEQGRRAIRRLAIIYKLNTIVNNCKTQEEILNKSIDLLFEALPADHAAILLTDPHDNMPKPVLLRHRDEGISVFTGGRDATNQKMSMTVEQKNITISRTMVNQCITQRVTILSCDTRLDERFKNSESLIMSGVRAAICVPLLHQTDVLGVLFIDTTNPARLFQQDDANFLSSFGLDLALTLANYNLNVQNLHQARLAAIGTSFAGLSHNIKNILQLAKGGMDLMETAVAADNLGQIKSFWPLVKKGVDRMTVLTQEILAFSNQQVVELQPIDVNATLGEMVQSFSQTASNNMVDLQHDFEENLPPYNLNAENLTKAIMNLLTNAMDAMSGLPGVIIVTTQKLDNGDLCIKVTDNGPGIPAEKLVRIWEPFYTTKGNKGTGLGLTMTHKYIQDMNGTIELESVLNQGTTFTIIFPAMNKMTNNAKDTTGE
ncbi:FHA domain-containing protein [Candidatus Sumerlaeota bacterium]|nr:FHA domain-containing protein [Candidatus Sumerlaeota bacterium]